MSSTPLTPKAASHLTAMIARAERRRATLEALAEAGAALAKEIAVRMIDGPYHPEPRNDPGRSFAAVSRSVRLTLVLEARVDEKIFALCNGDLPVAPAAPARPTNAAGTAGPCPDDETLDLGPRDSNRECLVESERGDPLEFDLDVPASPEVSGDAHNLEVTRETPLPEGEGTIPAPVFPGRGRVRGYGGSGEGAKVGETVTPHPPIATLWAPPSPHERGVPGVDPKMCAPPSLEVDHFGGGGISRGSDPPPA